LPSSAVNDISYTPPSPVPDLSDLTCAVSVPTPKPSGDVSPSPASFTGSSCVIPSTVISTESPSASVTPRIQISFILWFGGHNEFVLAAAFPHSGD